MFTAVASHFSNSASSISGTKLKLAVFEDNSGLLEK